MPKLRVQECQTLQESLFQGVQLAVGVYARIRI